MADAAPLLCLALAGTAAFYGVSEFVLEGGSIVSFAFYLSQITVALVAWWTIARRRGRPVAVILAADIVCSLFLAIRLLHPQGTSSGTALIVSLKIVATAVFLPWGIRAQGVSAGVAVLAFWTALFIRTEAGVEPYGGLHQPLGPLIAAVLSCVGTVTLTRARRQAFWGREELATSESHLSAMLESSPDGVFVLSDGRISFANPRLGSMLHYASATDLVGARLRDLVVADDQVTVGQFLSQAELGMRASVDVRFRCRDDDLIQTAITGAPLPNADPPAMQITVRDVTARVNAERLKASLLGLAEDIAGTLDLAEILDRTQRRTAAALPCDIVFTLRCEAHETRSRVISHFGFPSELARDPGAESFVYPPSADDRSWIVGDDEASRQAVWKEFPEPILRSLWGMTIMSSPLQVGGRHLGTIVACRASHRPFGPEDRTLLTGVAHQLAVAMKAANLFRLQQAEAEVWASLVRVGRELTALLDEQSLFSRLCALSAELLEGDYSNVWIWRPDVLAFTLEASHSTSYDLFGLMHELPVSREFLAPILDAMRSEDVHVIDLGRDDLQSLPLLSAATDIGITHVIYIALRHAGEIVGLQTVGYIQRGEPITVRQTLVARGIGQFASLAMANARLVEELGDANRAKSDFVASMSHELRTPLNVIIGYNDMLLEGGLGTVAPEQAKVLKRARRNAVDLLTLIDSTLDLSRLESGALQVNREPVDLRSVVRHVESEVRNLWTKPGVEQEWRIAEDFPIVSTDASKLILILRNLASNAMKFTPAGRVDVEVGLDDDGLSIVVADTGIGIAVDKQAVIFEPFRQADGSISVRQGGLGLGLHIVRRMVELLGGTIELRSEPGAGSTFCVHIPCDVAL